MKIMKKKIIIKGAKENNLKSVDLEIPRDKMIVFTGVSGSGKSSLAFDTIFADGQRRYMESLSSYARQFLGQMEKPNVDYIEGLSPAISIDQKTTSKNPRSTVGTVTEIYDYLRLLYARIGIPHCPICKKQIQHQTIDQIVDRVLELSPGTKIQLLAPIVRGKKGEHVKELDFARKSGFIRVRVDGILYDLSEQIDLDKNKKHAIEIVVDRLIIKEGIKSRLADSLETVFKISGGLVIVALQDGQDILFSQDYACVDHDVSIEELTPRMFSFNNPYGACKSCLGIGTFTKIDPKLIIPNEDLSIQEGAIKGPGWAYGEKNSVATMYYDALAKEYDFSLDSPYRKLSKKVKKILLYGTNGKRIKISRNTKYTSGTYEVAFEGIVNNLERRFKESKSEWTKNEISDYMNEVVCPECGGARLNPVILNVTVGEKNISELTNLSVKDSIDFLENLRLTDREIKISDLILKEIKSRLKFLQSVGLEYLTLSRSSGTLSGGESQRIRLATQIGSSLIGVLYILDEPSIGLHQKDNDKLIKTLKKLRDIGNTLIVVEHDEDTIRAADWVVDIGPGPGVHGGEVVFNGLVSDIQKCENSLTGQYLSGKKRVEIPKSRRKGNGKFLEFGGCCENNLKNINVRINLGTFTCVTGVSGSGKSSLVNQIIHRHLAAKLNRARIRAGEFKTAKGLENLDKVIGIDQSPIGRTPRSNPGTYTSIFNDVRELFSNTNDAKMRGYGAGRFSFNVKGGRCENCQGDGIVKIEMHFLPDIYIPCEVCSGKRYNRETLQIKYKDKNIYDILDMTVEEAMLFFENHPKIKRKLKTLFDVGLGYIKLGQPATTLSGGEAQRVKLATELSKRSTGRTIYILDEPTTGLHTDDVNKLICVLQKLVDLGNTVLLIEHNLDVIKTADFVIDLGPDGGDKGGEVVGVGTPEQIAENENSHTGRYLKKILEDSH